LAKAGLPAWIEMNKAVKAKAIPNLLEAKTNFIAVQSETEKVEKDQSEKWTVVYCYGVEIKDCAKKQFVEVKLSKN